MRIDKYMADCGVGSRSEIKKIIKSGEVYVAGEDKIKADTQIDENTARVYLRGKELKYRKFVYLMLNKPGGYLSATRDAKYPVVLDLVPKEYRHYELFPVGRLDIDTEGFCLLTNDGDLAHRITSPTHHVPKTYIALTDIEITEEDKAMFKEGIILDDGYKTKPAILKKIPSDEGSMSEITITEGKFHQIKRMFAAVGKKVIYLKRVSVNKLLLDKNLKPGEIRELTSEEIVLLEKGDE